MKINTHFNEVRHNAAPESGSVLVEASPTGGAIMKFKREDGRFISVRMGKYETMKFINRVVNAITVGDLMTKISTDSKVQERETA